MALIQVQPEMDYRPKRNSVLTKRPMLQCIQGIQVMYLWTILRQFSNSTNY
jgi:hypothetical protein